MNLITDHIAYTPVIFGRKVFAINQYRIISSNDKQRPFFVQEDFLGLFLNLGRSFEYCGDLMLPGTIRKGQYNIVYVPKGHYEIITQAGIHRSLTIAIRREEFEGFAKDFGFLQPLCSSGNVVQMARTEHLPIAPRMEGDIFKLLNNNNKHSLLRNAATESSAMSIFYDALNQIQFLSKPGRKYPGYRIDVIRDVAEHLEKNLSNNVTIEDLVALFGITKNRLQKGFKEVFGTTVHEYIVEKRMDRARQMLTDSIMPIHWIASAVGYKEVPNFTAAFKQRFKQSPSEFRGNDS